MASSVEVRQVSKSFRLYQEKFTSLKERAIHFNKVPFEDFKALDSVELTIDEGETVGLVGHNGSGKSTLLKCIAGILQPTAGEILVRGKVAAMLELGAGFHPDLSGRDNIFLNAALLGMSKREIERRFDAIVDFSELGPFIDNQVKFYSSGMYTRLGFAVAVNMDPDVLLVDEVLAVGDENFQRKCLDRIKHFQKEGRTIVFVSHSAELVRMTCQRAFVLDHGRIVGGGPTADALAVLREYQIKGSGLTHDPSVAVQAVDGSGEPVVVTTAPLKDRPVIITDLSIQALGLDEGGQIYSGDSIAISVGYEVLGMGADVIVGLEIVDKRGEIVIGVDSANLDLAPFSLAGHGTLIVKLQDMPLNEGAYTVAVSLIAAEGGKLYDWRNLEGAIKVLSETKSTGLINVPVAIFLGS